MTGKVLFNGGDALSETNLAEVAAKHNQSDYVERGLSLSPSWSTNELQIGRGHAVIRDETLAYDIFPDEQSGSDALLLPNSNGQNYVYLTFDPDAADPDESITYEIRGNNTPPSTPSLLVATADTSTDDVIEQNRAPDAKFEALQTDEGNIGSHHYLDANLSASEIQEALDNAQPRTDELGIGIVNGRNQEFILSNPIEIPSNVYLYNIRVKAAEGSNTDLIKSKNFDSLTGSNTGTIQNGAKFNIGLVNVFVDGNKANNAAGTGVQLYAKQTYIDNLRIDNCADVGIYSEMGQGTTTPANHLDQPEAIIGSLFVGYCDGDNIVWRGPNDSVAREILSHHSGGRPFTLEQKTDEFTGTGFRVAFLHCYASTDGIYLGTPTWADQIYGDGVDVTLDSGFNVNINHITVKSGGSLEINSGGLINSIYANGDKVESLPAVLFNGPIKVGIVDLSGFGNDGLVVDSNSVHIGGGRSVNNGGYGLRLGDTTNVEGGHFSLDDLNKNDNAAVLYNGGEYNEFELQSFISSGHTGWDTTDGQLPQPTDDASVILWGRGDGIGQTKDRGLSKFDGDGTTKGFTVNHNLLGSPSNVQVTSASTGSSVDSFRVIDITDTTFDVWFSFAPPSGTDNVQLFWEASVDGRQ
ncbi:hypothetical protein [Halorientalis regularis]|uniref:Uncharacterized protein n=1 Tax=Halorientalis regularis TaxID=660518 RepID=A0A1G7T2H5_9EURY|nr:hypothetical protein [Halorientalis regularis]SDG29451.1 hypothetical protein SAMN05216218_12214 [Halorientalis regularis]